jgi:beta-glucosidase
MRSTAANSIGTSRFVVDVRMDERTLREVYTPHFREAVRHAHVGSVVGVQSANGQHCAENVHPWRRPGADWGFTGFVVSD